MCFYACLSNDRSPFRLEFYKLVNASERVGVLIPAAVVRKTFCIKMIDEMSFNGYIGPWDIPKAITFLKISFCRNLKLIRSK